MFSKLFKSEPKRVYLDYAAATPLLPAARAAMESYLSGNFANPSAIHKEGQVARDAVEAARKDIASTFQVRPEFVTFTSGGTESNNLAIRGALMAAKRSGRPLKDIEVLTLKTEHPATLKTVAALGRRGAQVGYLEVREDGLIDLKSLREKLSPKTVLVTVAYANSEIGCVQKLHAIKKAITAAEEQFGTKILFHVDAAQAPLWLNCQFDAMKADLVSFDAAKCNGPKGVGVLLRSPRSELVPIIYGGGQEEGLRPGTENVAGVVGAAIAFQNAQASWRGRSEKVASVRDLAIEDLMKNIPGLVLNGVVGKDRLANNINVSLTSVDTEYATIVLDKHGFAVSTKSACAGAGGGESTVVLEISGDHLRAASTLRISLSPETKQSDLKRLTKVLRAHVIKMAEY